MEQHNTKWTSENVRKTFVDFFKTKEHLYVPSSSVVPHEDPSLLFTNSGMNQFKPIFLGKCDPLSEQAKWKRVANYQKCIRAGGKHNDLDDVGKDTYHHTFFEMLGSWSFGNYFKQEAITWSWELLTEVFKLDKSRIYVTYFMGDEKLNLKPDLEAKEIWMKFLPEERILPFGMKENFWEMGDTGPCGPSSEINYDKIGGRDAAGLVNKDDPDVIEIWNNVFIQYNREPDGSLVPLPSKHVDTGMGFERLLSIVQNVRNNYETDLFTSIFEEIQKITKFSRPYSGKLEDEDEGLVDMAYRVIADHIRTLTISINDGAMPGREGRGYVVRRILRRAVYYGTQNLKVEEGTLFMYKLVPVVIQKLSSAHPELLKNPELIVNTIMEEEELFAKTLSKGRKMFDKIAKQAKKSENVISSDDVYRLHTTYGFPHDLSRIRGEQEGLKVDIKGFEERMKKELEDIRGKKKDVSTKLVLSTQGVADLDKVLKIPPTEDSHKYESKSIQGQIKAIWNGSTFDDVISENASSMVGLILDKTNFYAQQGGQINDTGFANLVGQSSPSFTISDVQTFGGYVLHIGQLAENALPLSVGDSIELHVNREQRSSIKSNHTSTHMLNFALRRVLGESVNQRGSLVDHNRLRFDFSHGKPLTCEQLDELERIVRELIAKEMPVYTQKVPLSDAQKIKGLRAVFGESYPDPVRVVSVGTEVDDLLKGSDNNNASVEFCGGTHLSNTREAGAFAIVDEVSLASGIRRIVAVTGQEAERAIEQAQTLRERIAKASTLTNSALASEYHKLRKDIMETQIPQADKLRLITSLVSLESNIKLCISETKGQWKANAEAFIARAVSTLSVTPSPLYFISRVDVGPQSDLLSDSVKSVVEKFPGTAVLGISCDEENKKVSIIAHVHQSLVSAKGLQASEWARATAVVLGGKGGGKAEIGQGSGSEVTKVEDAIRVAEEYVKTIKHL